MQIITWSLKGYIQTRIVLNASRIFGQKGITFHWSPFHMDRGILNKKIYILFKLDNIWNQNILTEHTLDFSDFPSEDEVELIPPVSTNTDYEDGEGGKDPVVVVLRFPGFGGGDDAEPDNGDGGLGSLFPGLGGGFPGFGDRDSPFGKCKLFCNSIWHSLTPSHYSFE